MGVNVIVTEGDSEAIRWVGASLHYDQVGACWRLGDVLLDAMVRHCIAQTSKTSEDGARRAVGKREMR